VGHVESQRRGTNGRVTPFEIRITGDGDFDEIEISRRGRGRECGDVSEVGRIERASKET
jgi:hypothetical protein